LNLSNIIETRDLVVRMGGRTVLDRLSLEVPPGAIGLLGPNGAGKTTLIRTLLGLLRPNRGSVEVLGYRIPKRAKRMRQNIGYMPEDPVAMSGLSAAEGVKRLAELSGLPSRQALQRAHEALWYVGLGEERYRQVEGFSAGMQQRFKLAQALVHDPRVLFLDEPTNGLDPAGRTEMLSLLKDLAENHGKSFILSSHLLFDVEKVCKEVIVLSNGKLVRQERVKPLEQPDKKVFSLKLSGDTSRFIRELEEKQYPTRQNKDTIEVTLPLEQSTCVLFELALGCECEVLALTPREQALCEQFAKWLGAG
jgi:ABC-2 type transport system ATP-binding protein